jgi:hypothetical protein
VLSLYFKDAIRLNCRMIGVEQTGYGLLWSSDLAFTCRDWGKL